MHGPHRAPGGWIGARQCQQGGLATLVQDRRGTRAGLLGQRGLEALLDKAASGALDGRPVDVQGRGDRLVRLAFVGEQQDVGTAQAAGSDTTLANQRQQLPPLVLGQVDQPLLLGHPGALPQRRNSRMPAGRSVWQLLGGDRLGDAPSAC